MPTETRHPARCGAVLFAKDVARLARFYEAIVPLRVEHAARDHVVLAAAGFELVIHGIPRAIAADITIGNPPEAREDVPVKLLFAVDDLARVRARIAELGGSLAPANREWEARGFRACDGLDPEGNVIQFRMPA